MGSNSVRNAVHQIEKRNQEKRDQEKEDQLEKGKKLMGRWQSMLPAILLGSAAWAALGALPTTLAAYGEALKDWRYDAQTRSLNITLPPTVTPLVSVIAPDQLMLELPNTQVGTVLSQTVEDGIVESIVLEQATPETVRMTMEFAAGTVLSDAQYARPLTANENGDQQWQVRPALVSASRRAPAQAIAAGSAEATESSASSLRTEEGAIAQSPDFSDLPVLEPAMPIDEPVSVPPLNAPPVVPPTQPTVSVPPLEADTSVAAEDSVEDFAERSPVFEVEVIPAEPTRPTLSRPSPPVVSEPPVIETTSGPTSEPVSESLPQEPPFIGDLDEADSDTQLEEAPTSLPAEPTVVAAPPPTATDSVDERIASGAAPASPTREAAEPSVEEALPEDVVIESVQPSNVSRWPEPIPFGQPLPD